MAHTAEALTDTDHAILRAYGTGGQVTDIATTHKLTREDVGFRLTELCGLDRGRARKLSPPAAPTRSTEPAVDPAAPPTRVLTDTEQEVMRSFAGGHSPGTIAKAKRMEITEVDVILRLVNHRYLKAREAGRTGIITITPEPPTPAPRPRPAPAAPPARPTPAAATVPQPTADGRPTFTRREAQILPLLATTLNTDEIAAQLGLATSTVHGYASAMYRKLGADSRARAVHAARRLGILDTPASDPAGPASGHDDGTGGELDVTPTVGPDSDVDLAAIIAETGAEAAVPDTPADNAVPDEHPADTAPVPSAAPGPTVEISIIRAGRTWTTVVELDPDDVDTTVSVRVRPPADPR